MKTETRAISDIGTILCLMVALVFVLFLGYFVYQEYHEHQARQKYPLVKREFNQIQPLPGAVSTSDIQGSVNARAVSVRLRYRTNLPYNEVRAYYDAEVSRQGFKFQEESEAYDRRKYIYYSKGELTAWVDYEEVANPEYTYSFCVYWNP